MSFGGVEDEDVADVESVQSPGLAVLFVFSCFAPNSFFFGLTMPMDKKHYATLRMVGNVTLRCRTKTERDVTTSPMAVASVDATFGWVLQVADAVAAAAAAAATVAIAIAEAQSAAVEGGAISGRAELS